QLKAAVAARPMLDELFASAVHLEANQRVKNAAYARDAAVARHAIATALADYERMLLLTLDLSGGSGRLAMVCGVPEVVRSAMPADAEVAAQVRAAAAGLDEAGLGEPYVVDRQGRERFTNLVRSTDARGLAFVTSR